MASAGTVSIDFAAETAKFTTELKKVRGELAAIRSDTKLVSEAVSSFGSTLRGLVGAVTVVSTIRAIISATSEAAAAQAQLNSALATSTKNVKAAADVYLQYAQDLQRTTTFSDEAVVQIETLLLSFQGLSGQVVKDATAAVLDLSTRMGIDAPAAAKLLGRALADPEHGMTALARAGVVFTDGQKAQIKALTDAGNAAQAQNLILTTLEKNFGGAAAAARDTFGGALAGLKNSFGDLLEGDTGINAAAGSVNELSKVLSSPEVKQGFNLLIGGLAKVVELGAKAAAAIAGLARGTGEFFGELTAGAGGLDDDTLNARIKDIESKQERLRAGWDRISDATRAARLESLRTLDAMLEPLKKQQDLRASIGTPKPDTDKPPKNPALDFTTGGPDAAQSPTFDSARFVEEMKVRDQIEQDASNRRLQLVQGEYQNRLELEKELQGSLADLGKGELERAAEFAEQRIQIERKAQEQIVGFKRNTLDLASGLLQVLAQRHKSAAKALIVLEKARAISQVMINTAAAVSNVMATTPPWAWPAGIAMAEGIGAAQIGIIAATGVLEIGAVGKSSGGGAAGSSSINAPNMPLLGGASADDTQQRGASSQRAVQVIFAGPVYGMADFKQQLIDVLKEEVNGRDVVIINNRSRQAQELRTG